MDGYFLGSSGQSGGGQTGQSGQSGQSGQLEEGQTKRYIQHPIVKAKRIYKIIFILFIYIINKFLCKFLETLGCLYSTFI